MMNPKKRLGAGTGVLISKDLVLTVAHNIYDKTYSSENSGVKFYVGANGATSIFY
jgi:V8-like Glu-specific endopeptidase